MPYDSVLRRLKEGVIMKVLCLDLEGVLVPEVWVNFAEAVGIDDFKLTTRDLDDYDELMRFRLKKLDEHNLKLADIGAVIEGMEPLPGAREFVEWLGPHYQLVILSDTFYEFATPMMRQLGWPTLFCHRLDVASDGRILNYHLRQKDPKRQAVKAIKSLNFKTVAVGDSYNDVSMFAEADAAAFFRPAAAVAAKFSQYPVMPDYEALKAWLMDLEL